MSRRPLLLLLLLLLGATLLVGVADSCATQDTCGKCVQVPGCAWCAQENLTSSARCTRNTPKEVAHCTSLVNPHDETRTLADADLGRSSASRDAVLIKPQRVQLRLRVGQEINITVQYKHAKDYPVDLYYLMDLSASMEDDKLSLSQLGTQLATTMSNLTSDVRLGFGSFVDKVLMPYVSTVRSKLKRPCTLQSGLPCAPPYSYKNHLPLDQDISKFAKEVMKAPVSGNLDAPEGGLDAMMQAMVCTEDVGWRSKARKILIFSTDAHFHLAGDGRLAGLVEPNDERCHMKSGQYVAYDQFDYPSIAQINKVAREHDINVIFAVTSSHTEIYKLLRERIKGSAVGTLSSNSSNVVQLVKDEYSKLVDRVVMRDTSSDPVTVRYFSSCLDRSRSASLSETRECGGLHVGTEVSFVASIKVTECPSDTNLTKQTFEIKPQGLNESLLVELEMICSCPCESPGHPGRKPSSACSDHGDLQCGVCRCEDGWFGRYCECEGTQIKGDTSACRQDNSTERLCSGRGTCVCGQCQCDARPERSEVISGKYCECDNFSCKRSRNQVCGGPSQGHCSCGRCVCRSGWSGDACDCRTDDHKCVMEPGQKPCSGHGSCECGECKCDMIDNKYRYSGKYCEVCPTCQQQHCQTLSPCVECIAYRTGELSKENCVQCQEVVNTVDDITVLVQEGDVECKVPDRSDCTIHFLYRYDESGEILVFADKEKTCRKEVNVLAVVLGVIGGIVFIGLIILLVWKLLTSVHDRREYVKFEKERAMSKWDRGDNPLYKPSTSTFKNPTFGGD